MDEIRWPRLSHVAQQLLSHWACNTHWRGESPRFSPHYERSGGRLRRVINLAGVLSWSSHPRVLAASKGKNHVLILLFLFLHISLRSIELKLFWRATCHPTTQPFPHPPPLSCSRLFLHFAAKVMTSKELVTNARQISICWILWIFADCAHHTVKAVCCYLCNVPLPSWPALTKITKNSQLSRQIKRP